MSENEETKGENLQEHVKEELEAAAKDPDFVKLTPVAAPPAPPSEPKVTSGEADPPPVEKRRQTKRVLWVRYNDLSTLKVGADPVEITAEDRIMDLETKQVLDRHPIPFLASRPVATEIVLEEPKRG